MSDGTGGNGGGGGTAGGPDMSMTASMDMGPALPDLAGLPPADHDPKQHPPLPTMSSASGASTIKAPEIWTVVWKGDEALGDKVNTFNTWMLASDYWKNGMKDYGVGAGTAKGKLVLGTTPPATLTDAQLQSLITTNMGKNGWPTKTANTIISFVLDPATSVTQGGQPASCVQFDGYHSLTSGKVPYLVNAYCNDPTTMMPDWNNLTVTMSHEAGEAAGDWDLQHNRVVDSSTGAPYLGGGEVGDLCLSLNSSIAADATNTYMVQRLWSNSIAIANNADPCIPVDANTMWFGAGLYSGNSDQSVINVTLDASGKGSAQFKIEPFAFDPSFGPVGFYVVGSLLPAGITLTPDIAVRTVNGMRVGAVAYGNPGSTTNLTVNVAPPYTADGNPITFLIIARNVTKTHYNIWW
ncbi:MAG: hypothetical protein ACXVIH_14460, partial [Ilumatobacteraceae bacterium]